MCCFCWVPQPEPRSSLSHAALKLGVPCLSQTTLSQKSPLRHCGPTEAVVDRSRKTWCAPHRTLCPFLSGLAHLLRLLSEMSPRAFSASTLLNVLDGGHLWTLALCHWGRGSGEKLYHGSCQETTDGAVVGKHRAIRKQLSNKMQALCLESLRMSKKYCHHLNLEEALCKMPKGNCWLGSQAVIKLTRPFPNT